MPARRALPHADPRDWYQLQRWRNRAKHQLKIAPLCAFCRKDGRNTLACIADHIHPHRGDWNAFLLGDLQSLCKPCHEQTKKRIELAQQQIERDGYDRQIGLDGMPADPRHPVYAPRSTRSADELTSADDQALDEPANTPSHAITQGS